MNTTAIKDIVDQAQERGIKYVLLDTGWYGPEYDVNCDPRLDPAALEPDKYESDRILLEQYFATEGGYNNTGEGVFNTRGKGFDVYKDLGTPGTFQTDVDIPAICDYANARDVGIILYVNGVYLPDSSGRDRYGAEELFTYLKMGRQGRETRLCACARPAVRELHARGRRGGGPPSSDYDRPRRICPHRLAAHVPEPVLHRGHFGR